MFDNLNFNAEKHMYDVDGVFIPSTSSVIKELHKEFPIDIASTNVAKKHSITKEEVLIRWEHLKNIGCNRGTITHDHAEVGSNLFSYCIHAVNSYLYSIESNPNLTVVEKELRIYTKTYWIAGTCDLLLKNELTGKYILVDYKTNNDLFKTYNDMLFSPFDNYTNTPYNKYIIQLNTYDIMLEEVGIDIESRIIVWLNKRNNHSTYTLYNLPNIKNTLKEYYVNRRDYKQHKNTSNPGCTVGYGYYSS